MIKAPLNLTVEEAYEQVISEIARRKCQITRSQPPQTLTAVQGSLWGTSPKTAQKKITYTLTKENSETVLSAESKLTSGYINLTFAGVALSLALICLCVWIALDFNGAAASFWSRLLVGNDRLAFVKVQLLEKLMWGFAAFLAATLALEGAVLVRVRRGLDAFAKETVESLKRSVSA